MQQLLEEKISTWKILDLACGPRSRWPSQVVADQMDHTQRYPQKKFHQCMASQTPFEDKEFDFVIASHIAEHVLAPEKFMKELMRIGKRGYIEVPTPLFDNLVVYNRVAHHWWVTFDDVEKCLCFTKRLNVLHEYIGNDKSFSALKKKGFAEKEIQRIIRMVDLSEYKRRQGPPGVKITPKSFGKDRRLPITNRFTHKKQK